MKNSKSLIIRFMPILALLFWSTVASCPGCPNPTPTQQKWINCTAEAARKYGIPLVPKVNDCLTTLDSTSCLISLISPAAGITASVLACVVRDSGATFAETADDKLECGAVQNADAFIREHIMKEKGLEFEDGYDPGVIPTACLTL